MTRKEELEKIIADAQKELANLDKQKFRDGQIVIDRRGNPVLWQDGYTADYRPLTLEEVVLILAPPEAVRWEMDSSQSVCFYGGTGYMEHIVLPNHHAQDEWKNKGGEL